MGYVASQIAQCFSKSFSLALVSETSQDNCRIKNNLHFVNKVHINNSLRVNKVSITKTLTPFRESSLQGHMGYHAIHKYNILMIKYSDTSAHKKFMSILGRWTNWIIFNDSRKTCFCWRHRTSIIDKWRMKFSNWMMLMSLVRKANKDQEHIIKIQL